MLSFWKALRNRFSAREAIYPTFAEARAACGDGYANTDLIKVVAAKSRVAFAKPIPIPDFVQGVGTLIAVPTCASGKSKTEKVTVLDVGGGYGYHARLAQQVFPFISLKWAIVETAALLSVSKQFQTPNIRFFETISAAAKWLGSVDLVHASSSLQYFEDPLQISADLAKLKARFVLIQRAPFSLGAPFSLVQQSRLSDNGPGPWPDDQLIKDIKDRDQPIHYVAQYANRDELISRFTTAGYDMTLHMDGTYNEMNAGHRCVHNDMWLLRHRCA